MVSDDELLGLDEFALLHENAEQAGVADIPPARRMDLGDISAVKWGSESPQVVFLHGGGQNADSSAACQSKGHAWQSPRPGW